MSTTMVAGEFRARLTQVIRSFGSVVSLANAVGVSDNAIYKWLSGRGQPSVANLVALARAGKVSLEWLATGRDSKPAARASAPAAERSDYVFMPRRHVRISSARNGVIRSDQVVDFLAFSEQWLKRHFATDARDLILIEVVGDSMAPTVKDSDLILADLAEPRFQQDGIYLLRQDASRHDSDRRRDSGLSVKRVQRRPDGKLSVRCDNPAYEAITVGAAGVRILGRVIWIGGTI